MIKFEVLPEWCSKSDTQYKLTSIDTCNVPINELVDNNYPIIKRTNTFFIGDTINLGDLQFVVLGRIHDKEDLIISLYCSDYEKLRHLYGKIELKDKNGR